MSKIPELPIQRLGGEGMGLLQWQPTYDSLVPFVCVHPWPRRGGRVVEGGGLESRCAVYAVPWVRIPPSPPCTALT